MDELFLADREVIRVDAVPIESLMRIAVNSLSIKVDGAARDNFIGNHRLREIHRPIFYHSIVRPLTDNAEYVKRFVCYLAGRTQRAFSESADGRARNGKYGVIN